MSDYRQQINAWFAQFDDRMDNVIPTIISNTATEFFKERFDTQEWDKVPWQALNPKYAAQKTRGRGKILTKTNRLRRSIRPTVVQPGRIVITAGSASVPYARVHNEGLNVTGRQRVRAHTKRNFMGKGKPVKIGGHLRNVNFKMPKRQFMGNSRYLNQVLIDRITRAFNQ